MDFVDFSDGTCNGDGQCVNLVDQGIITEILGQFMIFIISKCVSVIILTYMRVPYGGLNTLSWVFSRESDQGIITEKFGQFLISIIRKCVSVILHNVYVHYERGSKLPLIGVI